MGKDYDAAVKAREAEIAWAKASIEAKFIEATAEATRLRKMRKPGLQPKDRRLV